MTAPLRNFSTPTLRSFLHFQLASWRAASWKTSSHSELLTFVFLDKSKVTSMQMCTKYSSPDSPLYYSVITIYGSFWSACVVHVLPQLLPNLPNLEIQFVLSEQCNIDSHCKSYDWPRDFRWLQLHLLYCILLCSKLHSSKLWGYVNYLLYCTTQEIALS